MSNAIKGLLLVFAGGLCLLIAYLRDKVNKTETKLAESKKKSESLEKVIEILQYADKAKSETAEKVNDIGEQGAKYEEMVKDDSISFSDLINDWNNGV